MIAAASASACVSPRADGEQKRYVEQALDAVPEDVVRALRLGDVQLHLLDNGDKDVYADRRMALRVRPELRTTTAEWVAGCRTAVAALSGTSARLYGRLPGREPLYEATGELCLRGIGHPLGRYQPPRLILGLTGAGGVTDTALDADVQNMQLEADGRKQRERGAALTVAEPDLAAWDLDTGHGLPWRYASQPASFVVPSGVRLSVKVECGTDDPGTHAKVSPQPNANSVVFQSGRPESPRAGARLEPCGTRLLHGLTPQLSYTTADGRKVDRYDVVVVPVPPAGEPIVEVPADTATG